jgi:hypothetical protein
MYLTHVIFSLPNCTVLENIFENILETLLVNVYLDVLETFADFTGYCTRDYWRLYVRFPRQEETVLGRAYSDCTGDMAFLL